MFQLSKKKIIIFIIIWIILIILTGGITYYIGFKNNNTIATKTNNNEEPYYNSRSYYSFYDENDLKVDKKFISDNNKEDDAYEYIKISGLKDKKIENKINTELYNYVKNLKKNGATSAYTNVTLNAFNILSTIVRYCNKDGCSEKTFNYDLVTGNTIEFDDLFTNTANILSIIYSGCYDRLSTDLSLSILWLERTTEATKEYNETGIATQNYTGSSLDDLEKQRREVQEQLDNVEILAAQKSKDIFNIKDKKFYLVNYGIVLILDDEELILKSKKYTEYFAFYEKYLTNTSPYEESNIGKKNLFLSGNLNYDITYSRVEKVSDYGLIDWQSYENELNPKEMTYVNKLIDEYKNKFDNNKFNYLNINSGNGNLDDIGYMDINIVLCKMNKNYFNNTYIKKLFIEKETDAHGLYNNYYLDSKDNNLNCQERSINNIVIDDTVYENVKDIFLDNFDYENYFMQKYYQDYRQNFGDVLGDYEEFLTLKNKIKYNFSSYGISVYFENTDLYSVWIRLSDIPKEYLKVNY